jgi:hypothetical protein
MRLLGSIARAAGAVLLCAAVYPTGQADELQDLNAEVVKLYQARLGTCLSIE